MGIFTIAINTKIKYNYNQVWWAVLYEIIIFSIFVYLCCDTRNDGNCTVGQFAICQR